MIPERIHHPSCAARAGGLCTGCPTNPRTETHGTTGIRLSCPVCRTEQVARGLDPETEERAALAGPTCCAPIFTSPTAAAMTLLLALPVALFAAWWVGAVAR